MGDLTLVDISLSVALVGYVGYAMVGSLSIRLILAFFKWMDPHHSARGKRPSMKTSDRRGNGSNDVEEPRGSGGDRGGLIKGFAAILVGGGPNPDFGLPFFIGFLELLAYPYLILVEPLGIGAWLAIKTAGQWNKWGDDRPTFNRFLLGNMLVIGVSVLGGVRLLVR